MPRVGIVTDSTCDLGPEALNGMDVRMVPLKVLFGNDTYLDWIDLDPVAFYEKLTSAPVLPKTSQPSPADFARTYAELAEAGCDAIVSVHLSSALSGTIESAQLACVDSPVPVHVVDCRSVSHGTGLVVRAAVEARTQGLDAAAIAERCEGIVDRLRILFVLDTLEYLVKGGRAGKAQGLAAAVLNIKPVLTVNTDGIIEPFKKVKGRHRALTEIAASVAETAAASGSTVRAAVFHGCDEEGAKELIETVRATGADVDVVFTGTVGAVIGTYAGPGAVGIAYYPV